MGVAFGASGCSGAGFAATGFFGAAGAGLFGAALTTGLLSGFCVTAVLVWETSFAGVFSAVLGFTGAAGGIFVAGADLTAVLTAGLAVGATVLGVAVLEEAVVAVAAEGFADLAGASFFCSTATVFAFATGFVGSGLAFGLVAISIWSPKS